MHKSPVEKKTMNGHHHGDEDHITDIEEGAVEHESMSSTASEWGDVVSSANTQKTYMRSRVKERRHSPTPSSSTASNNHNSNDDTNNGRIILLFRADSFSDSHSEDFNPPDDTTTHHQSLITNPIIQWLKRLALALVLASLVFNLPGIFLELAYFPARGRMLPGGLKNIISKPVAVQYGAAPQQMIGQEKENIHIPRIVHVTYKSREELPPEWELSIQQWEEIHPNWEVRFWSDKDIEEFVHTQFPEVEALHKSYKYKIQRIDSVRYMILHHFGGIYSDMDVYPAAALDKLLEQWEDAGKNVLLAETSNMGVTNAFMASAPQSDFMACVIENLPHYQHKFHHMIGWQHWEVLSSAGSTFLWGMVGHCQHDDQVQILDARSFRGCSVCDAWESGHAVDTCDTQWFHHSSTNSSWHQHKTWFHTLWFQFTYTCLCKPFRACFVCAALLLFFVETKKSKTVS